MTDLVSQKRNGGNKIKDSTKTLDLSYAQHLRELVAKAANVDRDYKVFGAKSHKYRLNPTVSIEEVQQFEQEYHLTLPEEYVFFLTKVGNGGAGPYYGLYSLKTLRIYNGDNQFNNNPVFIDNNLTLETWNQKVHDLYDDDCNGTDDNDAWDRIEAEILAGVLVIGTQGCTYDHLLMCKGSETGKIVYDNNDWTPDCPPFLTGMTFLDWYEQYFEEIIAGNDITSYGYIRLGTEAELLNAYSCAKELKEKSKILSGLFRFEKLSDDTIMFLEGITDQELDSARVQLLFKNDIKRGLLVFENLLERQHTDAVVDCARKMPQQYKNDYYNSMLTLLYGKNNTNKQKILYFLCDCSCKKAADIVAFATDEQNAEEFRKTAVYVMGTCDDVLDFMDSFILWMKGSSYWLAHTALQAMLNTRSASDQLLKAYRWMWDRYKNDSTMRANLQHAPITFDTI